ncbi:M20 family metallopeptidase [Oceanobacillus polygoni]|uniref:Glutamate carboxypeptidase n=1 Tax=Oceanobacillus polygoni TaxID=1235259 RepID=A0A9X1CAY2_9BACI|nr:M20 family metallopeptidase [Oceanobacillus polygoni]MBP2077139.1 glutamate carboxypeptidase [Oceanobacillus polygoni]
MEKYILNHKKEMLGLIEQLVNIDSGSNYKKGIDAVAEILLKPFKEMGFKITMQKNKQYGNNIVIQYDEHISTDILLVAHMDTVFPVGTVRDRPFEIKGNRAYGPGIIDMKSSLITLLYAVKALYHHNNDAYKNITIILNGDEEIGSPTSRKLIEEISTTKKYALIMEPARKDGSIVSARRGGGKYILSVKGKAAHSGVSPEEGKSAIEELAHKIIKLQQLNNAQKGISINVGVIEGGDAVNVVPSEAKGMVDVRITSRDQAKYVRKRIEEICSKPDIKGTHITLKGGINRLPLELNQANKKLLHVIQDVADAIGIELKAVHTGGGSDASFPANLGVATVDGLGPVGGGLHNEDEYLEIDSLTERCFLLAETISKLSE